MTVSRPFWRRMKEADNNLVTAHHVILKLLLAFCLKDAVVAGERVEQNSGKFVEPHFLLLLLFSLSGHLELLITLLILHPPIRMLVYQKSGHPGFTNLHTLFGRSR